MDDMENFDEAAPDTLSYDADIAYADQVASTTGPSLADRIGQNKVYLLSDSSVSRVGKRKRRDDMEGEDRQLEDSQESDTLEYDPTLRNNALLFQGTPISHLPTNRIFAYATHFDAQPLGLEWIDDSTCVLVFESNDSADAALRVLQKVHSEIPDEEGFVPARSIPMALWPPEEQINASLGKGEGLRGSIRMRWARLDDVKKRGARNESQFYKKHGVDAGKEVARTSKELVDRVGDDEGRKRRRKDEGAMMPTRAELDDELDAFLRDEPLKEPQEPSKMRSDYINESSSKSLLERTSLMRKHPVKLSDRIAQDSRRRGDHDKSSQPQAVRARSHDYDHHRRREERGTKSQQELDDELDAFLNDRAT